MINDHLDVNLSLSWCHFLWLRFLWENMRCLIHCNFICVVSQFLYLCIFCIQSIQTRMLHEWSLYPVCGRPTSWFWESKTAGIHQWLGCRSKIEVTCERKTEDQKEIAFLASSPLLRQSLQWIEETMNQTMKKPLKKNSCSFARTSCDYKRMKWKEQEVTPTTKS